MFVLGRKADLLLCKILVYYPFCLKHRLHCRLCVTRIVTTQSDRLEAPTLWNMVFHTVVYFVKETVCHITKKYTHFLSCWELEEKINITPCVRSFELGGNSWPAHRQCKTWTLFRWCHPQVSVEAQGVGGAVVVTIVAVLPLSPHH